MNELLTIADVNRQYPIPLGTLRYWRHRGTGPRSFKLGRRVMYRRADVDNWIEAQYDSYETRGSA